MRVVTITVDDLSDFRVCQEKERLDWWATFSAEPNHGAVFPYRTRGLTPMNQREDLRSFLPKLAEIADIYLDYRPTGGRFFVSSRGAFFHETMHGPDEQFVEFVMKPVAIPPSKSGVR